MLGTDGASPGTTGFLDRPWTSICLALAAVFVFHGAWPVAAHARPPRTPMPDEVGDPPLPARLERIMDLTELVDDESRRRIEAAFQRIEAYGVRPSLAVVWKPEQVGKIWTIDWKYRALDRWCIEQGSLTGLLVYYERDRSGTRKNFQVVTNRALAFAPSSLFRVREMQCSQQQLEYPCEGRVFEGLPGPGLAEYAEGMAERVLASNWSSFWWLISPLGFLASFEPEELLVLPLGLVLICGVFLWAGGPEEPEGSEEPEKPSEPVESEAAAAIVAAREPPVIGSRIVVGAVCPICALKVAGEGWACPRCGALHHEECRKYLPGCGIVLCGAAGAGVSEGDWARIHGLAGMRHSVLWAGSRMILGSILLGFALLALGMQVNHPPFILPLLVGLLGLGSLPLGTAIGVILDTVPGYRDLEQVSSESNPRVRRAIEDRTALPFGVPLWGIAASLGSLQFAAVNLGFLNVWDPSGVLIRDWGFQLRMLTLAAVCALVIHLPLTLIMARMLGPRAVMANRMSATRLPRRVPGEDPQAPGAGRNPK